MSKEFEEVVLNKLERLEQKFGTMETEVKVTQKELKDIKLELKDTQEVVNYLNNNFTKFDYEINKKIDTLFDAFTTNKEKDLVHDDNIVSLNAKIFNHDIRISNLEDKVLTA